jgi:hypothetical protein
MSVFPGSFPASAALSPLSGFGAVEAEVKVECLSKQVAAAGHGRLVSQKVE